MRTVSLVRRHGILLATRAEKAPNSTCGQEWQPPGRKSPRISRGNYKVWTVGLQRQATTAFVVAQRHLDLN